MNRALRAATVGVLLLSPVALSACSAGQVTQTATQNRDKTGAMAQVGDITVRAAELAYPRSGAYEPGDDAELRMVIVNGGQEADTLVGVKGEGFGGVTIQAAGTGTGAASPTTGTGAASPSTGSATPTTGTAAPTTSPSTGSNEIVIPANSTLFVDGSAATITLTDLKESLTVGQYIEVTLTFEKAGDVTLPVTVANPDQSLNRGDTFDFHPTEHAP